MFRTRLITGIVYIGFILWMIFALPGKGFDLMLAVVASYAMMEWINLIQIKQRWMRIIVLDLFILALISVFWFQALQSIILYLGVFLWVCMLPFLMWQQSRTTMMKLNTPSLVVLGALLLLAMYLGMTELMNRAGSWFVLMMFLIPWVADTSAYVVGSLWGKHKLIPQISPGKTWEGFLGAMIGSMILLPVYAHIVLGKNQVSVFFFIALLLLVIVSVVGDLFESYVKRIFGVKDSGNLLPGHGGVWDRLDSVIAVAPCFMMMHHMGWL